jgi:hypothetical protein
VIIQFAAGDRNAPNPTTTAILRAGELADRATYYRFDLFLANNPTTPPSINNPHGPSSCSLRSWPCRRM